MSSMFWTDERVAEMRKLHAEGYTARAIGAVMGVSRGTICGKMARLGIKPSDRSKVEPAKIVVPLAPTPKLNDTKGGSLLARGRIEARQKADLRPKKPDAFEDRPGSVALLDLDVGMCRWPFDIDDKPLRFCGCRQTVGKSYCAEHQKLSEGRGTYGEQQALIAAKAVSR